MLTVLTAAPTGDLCTLHELKDELGIAPEDAAQDTKLQRLIRAVSSALRGACGQDFTRETVRETLPGVHGSRLYLSRTPLVAISGTDGASVPVTLGVTIDGVAVTDAVIDDADAGSLYRDAGWPTLNERVLPISRDRLPGGAKANIVVTYVGGFWLPTFPTTATLVPPTLPEAISDAALELAATRWQERGRDRGLTAESLGDWSGTYGRDADKLAAEQLARYTRVHVC